MEFEFVELQCVCVCGTGCVGVWECGCVGGCVGGCVRATAHTFASGHLAGLYSSGQLRI